MKYAFLSCLGLLGQTVWSISGGPEGEFCVPCTDYVSGGFVGCGLGYASGPMKISQSTSTSSTVNWINQTQIPFSSCMPKDGSLSGFVGNLNMGYDCRLGNSSWSFGFIGGGSFTVIHGKAPFTSVDVTMNANEFATSVTADTTSTKWVDQGNFDAGFRTGYLFNRRIFCFLHTGWSIHRITFKTPAVNRTRLNKMIPHWYNCFLVGVGLDVRITEYTVVGVALDTHIGFRSKVGFNQGNPEDPKIYIGFYARPLLTQGMVVFKLRIPPKPDY